MAANEFAPVTPGEMLKEEFLAEYGLSQNQLAKAIGISPNRIAEIINNRRRITADTALRLSLYFGNSPEFWMNLQANHDLKAAYRDLPPEVAFRAMAATRRLAAILAADVAGYSRLIGADEEGTLERLKAHRRELIDPKIAGHKGRIVKTTGDGLLVEFASVVDAVRCAAEVQTALAERNAPLPAEKRIDLRVGIHQGDI